MRSLRCVHTHAPSSDESNKSIYKLIKSRPASVGLRVGEWHPLVRRHFESLTVRVDCAFVLLMLLLLSTAEVPVGICHFAVKNSAAGFSNGIHFKAIPCVMVLRL